MAMADDITLTVHVRDMTRGDFARIRQRMQGMDGDIRRVSQSTAGASRESARFSQNLQQLGNRLQALQRTGGGARSEMVHMRRTMSLLGRELRGIHRDGGLTEDEFRSLSRQLERTSLDFDHLTRDVERHSAVANRAAREEAQRQAASQRMGQIQARAQRETARRNAQLQAQVQRMGVLQARAQREEATRQARAQRDAAAAQTRGVTRLAGLGGDDAGLTARFQGLGDRDTNRMASGLAALRNALTGVTGSSTRAQRTVRGLGEDLQTMTRILQNAQQTGNLSRREFNALSNGLHQAALSSRGLVRSGDMSRASFRNMRTEISRLRTQLRLLGNEGGRFDQLNGRLRLLQGRMRDAGNGAGVLRRSFTRLGDWGLGGVTGAIGGMLALARGVRILGARFAGTTRFMKIFMAVLLLIAPAAQALGALLTVALGGAFVALGAFALRGNAEVKSAFQDMKGAVSSTVKEAALPMKDDLVGAIRNVGIAARGMQPQLTKAFTAAGPLINNMFGAITDFAASALPGFVTALEHSEMAMAGFRKGMGLMGDGFGDMFAVITKGNEEELARAWVVLGNEIRNVLVSLGEFMSTALNSGTASLLMIGIFRTFTGALNVMAAALDTVDAIFGSLFTHIADGISGFTTGENAMAAYFGDSKKSVADLKKTLADYDKQISDLKKNEGEFKNAPEGIKEAGLKSLQEERAAVLAEITRREEEATAATLNHAKSVAELIQQIQSLAELNRNYLDAQSAQEAAIDAAVELQKNHASALKMVNGQLDLTSKSGQEAYDALSNVAKTTQEATNKAIEANAPWEQVTGRWKTGRDQLVTLADSMGLTSTEAKALADRILGMPPAKELIFKARTEEATANLDSVIAAFQATPGEKIITVKALGQDAMNLLRTMGFTITQLPDGQFQITAKTADAKRNIGLVQAARDGLKGKSIKISIPTDPAVLATYTIQAAINAMTGRTLGVGVYTTEYYKRVEAGGNAIGTTGSIPGITKNARGNLLSFYADGGMKENHVAQIAPRGSWRVWAEDEAGDEAYIPLASNKRPRSRQIASETVDRLGGSVQWFAKGGNSKSKAASSAAAKSQRDAQGDLRRQMSLGGFGPAAGFRTTSMEKGLGRPGDLASLVNSLNSLNGAIKKAFSGSKEAGLLKQLDRSGKALIKYEKKLEGVNKRLDSAKDKLNGLRQEANSLRESVKSGVLSATNITGAAETGKPLTMSKLMTTMTEGRDKASAFASAIEQLRSKGVSKEIIQQISEAGISGGGLETAGALLGASGSEIASLNKMQTQINQSAKAAGDSAAGAMFNAGIKAADGLVKGLTKQKKAIEKAMMDIAKSMEKAIRRALGIKSPSTVMQEVGHMTAEGFSVGMEKNSRIGNSWDSMLTTKATSGPAPGASYGSSGGTYTFPIYIGNKMIDEVILDSNRRTVRTRGGNVQSIYGRPRG
jgi:hypothetical protein